MGLGEYVKDRERVAGFLPHRFSKVPEIETWQVQRIELVGVSWKHSDPVVYLSDRFPAMAELRDALNATAGRIRGRPGWV